MAADMEWTQQVPFEKEEVRGMIEGEVEDIAPSWRWSNTAFECCGEHQQTPSTVD